jgi:hypothetical protein
MNIPIQIVIIIIQSSKGGPYNMIINNNNKDKNKDFSTKTKNVIRYQIFGYSIVEIMYNSYAGEQQ